MDVENEEFKKKRKREIQKSARHSAEYGIRVILHSPVEADEILTKEETACAGAWSAMEHPDSKSQVPDLARPRLLVDKRYLQMAPDSSNCYILHESAQRWKRRGKGDMFGGYYVVAWKAMISEMYPSI